MAVSDGALVSTNSGSTYALLYFNNSPVTIATGETLSISYTYSFNSFTDSGDPWMRNGVFNSTTSTNTEPRIGEDGGGTENNVYRGYTGYLINESKVVANDKSNDIWRRKAYSDSNSDSRSNNLATSGGKYDNLIKKKSGFAYDDDGTEYTALLEISNVGTGMEINFTISDLNNPELFNTSWLDESEDAVNSFDTFLISTSTNVNSINIHQVSILKQIPEPSSTLSIMASLLFFGGVFSRHRRA